MRFLVDENTGPTVARWLKGQGYEVFSVYSEAKGLDDEVIIQKAAVEEWIIITNDKDFGDKVFRDQHVHRGVILLRLKDERNANKIKALQRLLSSFAKELPDNFVVVTENRVRFARSKN